MGDSDPCLSSHAAAASPCHPFPSAVYSVGGVADFLSSLQSAARRGGASSTPCHQQNPLFVRADNGTPAAAAEIRGSAASAESVLSAYRNKELLTLLQIECSFRSPS